jgi:hypothetical protein
MYGTEAVAAEIAKRINNSFNSDDSKSRNRTKITKRLETIDTKIQNLIKAIANGLDMSMAKPEIDALKAEKGKLESELKEVEKFEIFKPKKVSAAEILEAYKHLESAFELQDPAKKRKLLRNFVRRLEYEPKSDSLTIYMFAGPAAVVFHSNGAQDGAHFEWHIENASSKR